jgi:hypothetical protein
MKSRSHDEAIAEFFQVDMSYVAELLLEVVHHSNEMSWPF